MQPDGSYPGKVKDGEEPLRSQSAFDRNRASGGVKSPPYEELVRNRDKKAF